jgi:selenocysteine-specific elongation factor
MTAEEQRIWEKVRPLLEEGGLRPPRVLELAAAIDLEAGAMERFLNRAARLGMVMRVAKNRFYPPDALAGLARIAEELAGEAEDGSFYAKDYRDRSGIGRNVTIQVLEYFDKAGFTRRQGEAREIVAPAKEIFGQP